MYFDISIMIAPMLDIVTIKMNSPMLNGLISKNLPNEGMNIDVAMIVNELKTANSKYLFLKIPTFSAG